MPKRILSSILIGAAALIVHASASAADGATFISQSVPNSMQAGKSYAVSVTYKNSGTTTWVSGSQYRLAVQNPLNTRRWGLARVDLAEGAQVPPNGLYTFTFNVSVADPHECETNGNEQLRVCGFQWGMLQEYKGWLDAGVNTQVQLFDAPPVLTHYPAVLPPVSANATAFNATRFRGANMLMQTYEDYAQCDHTAWLPDAAEAAMLIDNAVSMGLNVLRIPVILPPKVPGKPADWMPRSPRFNTVCGDPRKNEWGDATDGVAITEGILAKVGAILDQAHVAHVKVILVIDGYTKYDDTCYWKKSFLDVKDNAVTLVNAFKSHPGLLAWDLLNEPLWNAAAFDCLNTRADYTSVVDAVHAMYNLVRSRDPLHPTTVGEHQVPLLKYWNDISSFASPHLYIYAHSGDERTLDQVNYVQRATMREMRTALGAAMPLVIGEFGSSDRDDAFNARYAHRFLDGLIQEDSGFLMWSLSSGPYQQGFSVLTPHGTLKPAARMYQRSQWYPVVQQLYLGYVGFPADPQALANFSAELANLQQRMRARGQALDTSLAALAQAYQTEAEVRLLIDSLYHSAEFTSYYTPADVPGFVSQIYERVFQRQPEPEGLAYWSVRINAAPADISLAVLSIMAGRADYASPQGVLDASTLRKKTQAAAALTASLNTPARVACYSGDAAVAAGRALLMSVNANSKLETTRAASESVVLAMCGL